MHGFNSGLSILFHLSIFLFFFPLHWEVGPRRSCFDFCHQVFCLCFPLRILVSGLTFRSLIHFEFIFVYGIRKCSNFILLHIAVQLSKHRLLKRLSFLHCIVLPPLSKIWCPQVCEFYLWAFYLVALVYTTIFVPEPYCLNDYSFVV